MRKRAIRQDIIDTASRLFYKQGYSNTGINQIIEEAGVAKTSLYKYFDSKEDLLTAYLEQSGERTYGELVNAIGNATSATKKIIAVFDYLEQLVQQNDFHGCNFLNIIYEIPEDAVRAKEHIKLQKNNVRKLFSDILRPSHKEGIADEVYTLYEGALIGNKVYNDIWPIDAARKVVAKLLQ
jgi:AcrR family transcriptional regulator